MGKKTVKESKHIAKVAAIGCVPCLMLGYYDTPAEIHHAKRFGGDQRNHMRVIPMCPEHHRNGEVSRHGSPFEFSVAFGSDQELLDTVEEMLSALFLIIFANLHIFS